MSGIEIRDPRFEGVVGRSVDFEQLATGFIFTEGPLWHRRDKYLLFSDMPGDHLRRWSQQDGVSTFRKPCNKSNGLAWDHQGRLIACEHASSHLTRTEADGSITVLVSHHDGKELNSPNDVVVKSDGAIYFSDPTYGRKEHFGVAREPQLAFRGVYRITPDGEALTLLADDFGQPNGLCFSLDEKVLFVNDTDRQHIRAFDVKADGTLANNRIWAKTVGDGAARLMA
jgi:gluconolactonase